MDKNLTSYCGLCCNDCIPSNEEFFALVDKLDTMLVDLRFEQYAALKSEATEEFRKYPAFVSVLHQIGMLRCSRPCRCGGGYSQCTIRQCAKDKGFTGCWQCTTRADCSLLDRLRLVHPYLDHHLDLIEEMGPAEWFSKRKEHYRWQVREKDSQP